MLKSQTPTSSAPNDVKMQLNWATLKFSHPSEIHLEKIFLNDYFSKNLNHVRYCHFYTILFYLLSGFIDYFLFPNDLVALFTIRFLVVVPVIIIGYIFTYSRHYKKVWQHISFLYILITGWSFIIFTMIAQAPSAYGYYVGILYCMMFGYTFIRERLIYASIAGLILFISYLFISTIIIKMPVQDLFLSNFYLLLANFLGMLIARHLEISARRGFCLEHKLTIEQEKFIEFNNQLEHIVETRTRELQNEIVERKQVEKALRESQDHLNSLFRAAPTGIGVVVDRVLIQVNQQICEMTGYAEDELVGQSSRLFYLSDEDFEFVGREKYKQIRELGTGTVEVRWKHKKGSIIDVLLSSTPMDPGYPSKGVTFTALNITDRKRAQEALLESEEKYRTMIERSNDMIWALDRSGKFSFFNTQAETVTGLDLNDWIGKSFTPLILKEDLAMVTDIFKKGMEGISSEYELRFKKRHDEILTISVNTASLIKDGRVVGVVSFGRDITERKIAEKEKAKLESQLQQSQKMESIGTLAGGIAHDFNNILSGIFGYAELLQMKMEKGSDQIRYLDSILKAGNRAKDLVTQILTFSRRSVNQLSPMEIQHVVKEALKLVESLVPSTITLHQRIQKKCGLVLADHTQIHQIVMNLCTNAYHAMEETGGELTVSLKEVELTDKDLKGRDMRPATYIELTVADTGTGIHQGIIERIFDPYFTTKEEGKGTGMGLAVIHGIVKSHGGHIRVESEPGSGTEFCIHLPVIEDGQNSENPEAQKPIKKGDERILLVDDQKEVIDIEQKMLEVLGYQVTATTSSVDALNFFRSNPDSFDLVVTDMTMPRMTGDQLADELINIRSDIPVILCTGFSEKMSEKKAASLGIRGFIMKPVGLSDLSATVRKVLDDK
jgi:PAS domain S-box-containing protein